jgi:hypothetical protein
MYSFIGAFKNCMGKKNQTVWILFPLTVTLSLLGGDIPCLKITEIIGVGMSGKCFKGT